MIETKKAKATKFVSAILALTLIFSAATGLFVFAAAQTVPYPVWGYVNRSTGDSVPAGVEVNITDVTRGVSVYNTTDATGAYSRDVYGAIYKAIGILPDNDEFTCSATYGGEAGSCSFVLNRTTNISQRCDIRLVGVVVPDLNVSSISINPGDTRGEDIIRVYVNESNNISALVWNNGTAAAGAFDVCFDADGVKIGCVAVTGLVAGANTTVSIDWTPTCANYPVMPGFPAQSLPITINVTADCNCLDCPTCPGDGSVAESDETNNKLSKFIPAIQQYSGYDVIGGVVNNGYKSKNFDCNTTEEPLTLFEHDEELYGGAVYNVSGTKVSTFSPGDTSTRVHHIDIPAGMTVKKARLYVYWYDKWGNYKTYPTGCLANLSVNISGTTFMPDVKYNDQKGFGYYHSPKGTYAYDVTSKVTGSGDYTVVVENIDPTNKTTLLGEMLYVVYEGTSGRKIQVWALEGNDYLYAADDTHGTYNFGVSPEEATATVAFPGTINVANVSSATLVTVVAQGMASGSNMLFNGNVIKTDAWDLPTEAYSGSKINVESVYVKSHLLSSGNTMGFQDNGTAGMQASNAFLVVTYTGLISGRVTDSTGTTGIEGVSVTANGEATLTDASGYYGMSIEAGKYNVSASKSGYVTLPPKTVPVTITPGGREIVNFQLARDYVEIGLKAGETTTKVGNINENISFNLIVMNHGEPATYDITKSSTSATVFIEPNTTGLLSDGDEKSILVNINASINGSYPVTISAINSSKSASTMIVALAMNTSANGTYSADSAVEEPDLLKNGTIVQNNSEVIGNSTIITSVVDNATVNNAEVTESFISEGSNVTGGKVEGSTVTNANTTATDVKDSTIENSVTSDTTITDSFVLEGSNVTGGSVSGESTVKNATTTNTTVEGSTVEDSDIKGGTIKDAAVKESVLTEETAVTNSNLTKVTATNCTITGVTLQNIELEKATVAENVTTGKAEIAGGTNAKVNTSGAGGVVVHFEDVYENVAVEDLVKNQTVPRSVTPNEIVPVPTSEDEAKDVGASLSLNSSVAGNVTISKCGISPGGSTFAVEGVTGKVGDFIHINTDIPEGTQMTVTICLYYGKADPGADKYITWYNETTLAWESLTTTKVEKADGWYLCTDVDHLSVFAIAAAVAVTPPVTPAAVYHPGGRPTVTTNVPVDSEGKVTTTTTLSTEKATLTIPVGIIVKDAEGNPLATSITMQSSPSTAETVGAIAAYDFGPSGTTFSEPIDLVIEYDPADVPTGAELEVKMYDGTAKAWIDLPTTVDTVTHTATAKVSHFTIFALFAAPPAVVTPTAAPTAKPTIPPVTPTPTPPVVPPVKRPWGLIIGIIIAVIVVGAAAYYFYTKKKA